MKGTEFVNRRNFALNLYKYYCTCHFGIDCRSFRGEFLRLSLRVANIEHELEGRQVTVT